MEFFGIFWNLLEFFGIFWNFLEYFGTFGNILQYFSFPEYFGIFLIYSFTPGPTGLFRRLETERFFSLVFNNFIILY